jgi:hypothetical protein
MKTFLVGFFLILGVQAQAAAATSTPEFIAHFVQKVNDRLETTNTERALDGSRPYCAQLDDQQMSDIENLFVTNITGKANQIVYRDLSQITAGQFIADASENLGCFPTSWLPGRSSIGHFFFGTKAYVMDHLLIRKSLEDLVGRSFDDSETLSQLLTH